MDSDECSNYYSRYFSFLYWQTVSFSRTDRQRTCVTDRAEGFGYQKSYNGFATNESKI